MLIKMNIIMKYYHLTAKFFFVILILSSGACEAFQDSFSETTLSNTSTETGSIEDNEESSTEASSENCNDHEDDEDYSWDESEVISIVLNGSSITAEDDSVVIDGSTATIKSAGTYTISGSLSNGQIIVDTDDDETVRLILNGVNISCSTSSPIYITDADKTIIVLADNSENTLTDGTSYTFEDPEDDEPNATLFSKDDITIYGEGSLTIDANYNDAVSSKDGLIVKSGTITIDAVDDGIRGKDYLVVKGGTITIEAQGDGLKSDNEDDTDKGYVLIEDGNINITSDYDAIDAATDVIVYGGEITIESGGGSNGYVSSSESAKGIKAAVNIIIDDGTLTVNSADDAIHSNNSLAINGGTLQLSSGDDGAHSDTTLAIYGGEISVEESYEGIESANILINSGTIRIVSSDDGINAAGGSGTTNSSGGRPGQTTTSSSGTYYFYLYGGYVFIDADGDGLDVNGTAVMTDGTFLINGPTSNSNGALDYTNSFTISDGLLIAAGSSSMAQAPGSSSEQYSVLITFRSTQSAGKLIHVESSDGTGILNYAPTKKFQSIAFSSPDLVKGTTYDIYIGGSSTGTETDGLYTDGTYTAGDNYTSFTVSSVVTKVSVR